MLFSPKQDDWNDMQMRYWNKDSFQTRKVVSFCGLSGLHTGILLNVKLSGSSVSSYQILAAS